MYIVHKLQGLIKLYGTRSKYRIYGTYSVGECRFVFVIMDVGENLI